MSPGAADPAKDLEQRIHRALPQTQCTRCGYPDCAGYAKAIASGLAEINQCPPGGAQGVERLSRLTGRPALPLNPDYGSETARSTVYIDENWCIGCTLCVDACPVDAIVGSNKRMHTVLESHCTGCALCLPVCPVDCMLLENATGEKTGWNAWSATQAEQSRLRYQSGTLRRTRAAQEQQHRLLEKAEHKLADLQAHSRHTDPAILDHKRAVIAAAVERARAKRNP